MEIITTNTTVHSKKCIGCTRKNKDIMLSFLQDGTGDIHDVFLSQDQAKVFRDQLEHALLRNDTES